MKKLLKYFRINSLDDIDYIKGRVANEKDFKEGKAIFYLSQDTQVNKSVPIKIGVPFFAYLNKKSFFGKKKILVIIVQAEKTVQGSVLGYLDMKKKKGVCTLEEIERIES